MKNRSRKSKAIAVVLLLTLGCAREERGPMLAGGQEVKSWLADLQDPKPQVRRRAVLELGNVGDADPAVAEALSEAIRDSDPTVRRDAVTAVAKLIKPSDEILVWLRIMCDKDPDSGVRELARRAVAHFDKTD